MPVCHHWPRVLRCVPSPVAYGAGFALTVPLLGASQAYGPLEVSFEHVNSQAQP